MIDDDSDADAPHRRIRVHGVAGTHPRRILQTDPQRPPRRTTSEGMGLYRVRKRSVSLDHASLEAFSWSDLTSGKASQGFRALLAPLLLVNASGWMFPRARNSLITAVLRAATRVVGLATTGFLIVGITWAFYLAPGTACRAVRDDARLPDGLRGIECGWRGWNRDWSEGGIAIGLALAVTLLWWALWSLGRLRRTDGGEERLDLPPELEDFDWVRRCDAVDERLTVLVAVHWLFSMAIIGASWAVSRGYWLADGFEAANGHITLFAVEMLGCAVLVALIDPGTASEDDPSPLHSRVGGAIVAVGCGAVAWLHWPSYTDEPETRSEHVEYALGAHFDFVNHVAYAYAVTPLMLVLAIALLGRWVFAGRNMVAGLRATSILSLGTLLGGVIAAGVAFAGVLIVGLKRLRLQVGGNPHLAIAMVATGLFLIVFVLVLLVQQRSVASKDMRTALATVVRRRYTAVTIALVVAQLLGWFVGVTSVDQIGIRVFEPRETWWILSGAVITIVALLLVGHEQSRRSGHLRKVEPSEDVEPSDDVDRYADFVRSQKTRRVVLGAALVVVIVLALVVAPSSQQRLEEYLEWVGLLLPLAFFAFLVSRWLASADSRRGLGTAADVTTFWPRSYHPLVPRPYSRAAILELSRVIERTTDGRPEQRTAHVAGHSQGSLLCMLAMLRLDASGRERRTLMTYGNPVGHLYHQTFPATFDSPVDGASRLEHLVDGVADRTRRWVNLHRDTDPIAGELPASGAVSVRVPEPSDFGTDGHSKYETTELFMDWEKALVGLEPEPDGG